MKALTMKKALVAAGAATMLSLGALSAPTAARAQPSISVQIAPPPPRFERMPPPRRGKVWAPGHWQWRHGRYVWVSGQWMHARPGYAYRAPGWHQRDGRWEYAAGRWDRDRDGIPDRYERYYHQPETPRNDRDGDGIANRYDRDRDGDGVRNRYDRRPDDPRRH